MQDPVVIGKLGKPHGLKGELRVLADREEYLDFLEPGGYVLVRGLPYRIRSVRDIGGVVIALEGLPDRSAVEAYKDLPLAIPYSEALANLEPEEDLSAWEGFMIHDTTTGRTLGPIRQVLEMATQFLALVDLDGREIMIPLHEDFILDIDPDAKLLTMELPRGLLEL